MNRIFKIIPTVIVTLFFSFQARADIEVSCILEDCFANGWHIYDAQTGDSSLAVCREDDCFNSGWKNEVRNRVVSETFCKAGGCFYHGWTVYDTRSGRVISDTSCQSSYANNNCLEYGWTTFEPGRGSYVTRCIKHDCATYGWDVQAAGFATQRVRCKNGACFSIGWIIYR